MTNYDYNVDSLGRQYICVYSDNLIEILYIIGQSRRGSGTPTESRIFFYTYSVLGVRYLPNIGSSGSSLFFPSVLFRHR